MVGFPISSEVVIMSEANSTPELDPHVYIPPNSLDMIGCQLFRPSQITTIPDRFNWLWDGYLALQQITLLTGQWKIGKTSLLSCLLSRMGQGGELVGLEVKPGRAIVLSEEGASLWRGRSLRHGIGEHVEFAFRPFLHRPTMRHWGMLMENLKQIHRREKLDLVVFDPLATLWPCRDENSVASILEALEPIRDLAREGPAVLLLHHPRKLHSNGGCDSRGSGAMTAFVDCLMEMHWFAPAGEPDRRRRLMAWSRRDTTPRQLLIEMTADGTDYVTANPAEPEGLLIGIIVQLLEAQPNLCASEILDRWPAGQPRPRPAALYAVLSRAIQDDLLVRTGTGNRYDPYRFRCKGSEAIVNQDPV